MRTETSLTLYYVQNSQGKVHLLGSRTFSLDSWSDGYWEESVITEFGGKKGSATRCRGEELKADAEFIPLIGTTDLLEALTAEGGLRAIKEPGLKQFLKVSGVRLSQTDSFFVLVKSDDEMGLIGTNMVRVSRDGIRSYDESEDTCEEFPQALIDRIEEWNREVSI